MLNYLRKKWKVSNTDLFLILCVFAITGTTTAYLSKVIPGWIGFSDATHWGWKLLLRLVILILGYQIVLLTVAFLFGQFAFFWQFEKKMLARLGLLKEKAASERSLKERI